MEHKWHFFSLSAEKSSFTRPNAAITSLATEHDLHTEHKIYGVYDVDGVLFWSDTTRLLPGISFPNKSLFLPDYSRLLSGCL